MISRDYSYYKNILKGRKMPLAFVDLEYFLTNLDEMAERANGLQIRIATKSVRSRYLLNLVLKHPSYRGIMTYDAFETVWLSKNGFNDILLGYPVVNEQAIVDICSEILQGKHICLMVDSEEHASLLNRIAVNTSTKIPVCIDMDMSVKFPFLHFGVLRSTIKTPEQVLSLCKNIQSKSNLELYGIMGYEAQIAGLGEKGPNSWLLNILISVLRKVSIKKVKERRKNTMELLNKNGITLSIVNGGGTGSLESSSNEPWLTEVSAGSGLFSPSLFDYYKDFRHLPAAGYAVEVVRKPKSGVVTCAGGGYNSSGKVGIDKQATIYLPRGYKLTANEGVGEVQTPVYISNGQTPELGDPILLRYAKAGEFCERFNELLIISNGKVVEQAATYRGEGKVFM